MVIQESYPVQADDMTAAGDVSARIKQHMKRLGVPAAVMRRVSVCTYEAEINLVIHSDGGQIDFEIAEDRITVQTHMNVIAVAALMDFACVVFPESLPVEAAIVDKARQEDVILLSSGQTAFELAALLAANGVPPARKE